MEKEERVRKREKRFKDGETIFSTELEARDEIYGQIVKEEDTDRI